VFGQDTSIKRRFRQIPKYDTEIVVKLVSLVALFLIVTWNFKYLVVTSDNNPTEAEYSYS